VPAIDVVGLRRVYETTTGVVRRRPLHIEAVKGIDLEIDQGELFGLLGPNGAGKTTTIKMLATLLLPTSGTAHILGLDVASQPRQVRPLIGYVFGGDRGLYLRLSALDNLRYFAELYGLSWREQRERIGTVLDLVGLVGRERERVEGYSRGMRQRLHIARGILHDPPVLFLDEPTIGVDPVGARELRSTIGLLAEVGKTILLTTHYMFEADVLCSRIAVIKGGQLIAQGKPAELKEGAADLRVLEIEAFGVPEERLNDLRSMPEVQTVSVQDRENLQLLQLQSKQAVEITQAVLGYLEGIRIGRVSVREPTLEDAYVDLMRTDGP
jgi:ABC-2 type transport system ATP-binding protein